MVAVHLHELRQLLLLDLDVDVRVAVVVEDTEEPVDANVDARRLEELGLVGVDLDASLCQIAGNRRVREDHAAILRATIRDPRDSCVGPRLPRRAPPPPRGAAAPDPPAAAGRARRAR